VEHYYSYDTGYFEVIIEPGSCDGTGDGGTTGDGTGGGTTGGGTSGDGGSPASLWDDVCGDWTLPDAFTIGFTGSTELAGSGVPSSCELTGHDANDASHIWNPPSSGVYCINTDGSEFDTVLSIWDGDCEEELECDDDGGTTSGPYGGSTSAISVTVAAGMAYVIVVDGWRDYDYGAYTLNVVPGECG
jgi:hypothetical protein